MIRDALADQEHGKIIRKVVAVVHKQVVGLLCIHFLQRLQVFENDLDWQIRSAQLDDLHWLAMVGGASTTRLDTLPKVVFNVVQDDCCVVYSVYLYIESAILPKRMYLGTPCVLPESQETASTCSSRGPTFVSRRVFRYFGELGLPVRDRIRIVAHPSWRYSLQAAAACSDL